MLGADDLTNVSPQDILRLLNAKHPNDNNNTVLHQVTQAGVSTTIFYYLSQGANFTLRNDSGESALDVAARICNVEIFVLLLNRHILNCEKTDEALPRYTAADLKHAFATLQKNLPKDELVEHFMNGILGNLCPASGALQYYQAAIKLFHSSVSLLTLNSTSWLSFLIIMTVFVSANYYRRHREVKSLTTVAEKVTNTAQLALSNFSFHKIISNLANDSYKNTQEYQISQLIRIYHEALTSNPREHDPKPKSTDDQKAHDFLSFSDYIATFSNLYLSYFLCALTGFSQLFDSLIEPLVKYFFDEESGIPNYTLPIAHGLIGLIGVAIGGSIYYSLHKQELERLGGYTKQAYEACQQAEKSHMKTTFNMFNTLNQKNISIPAELETSEKSKVKASKSCWANFFSWLWPTKSENSEILPIYEKK